MIRIFSSIFFQTSWSNVGCSGGYRATVLLSFDVKIKHLNQIHDRCF